MNRPLPDLTLPLRRARLRLHRTIVHSSVGLTSVLAVCVLAGLWDSHDHNQLLGWAACLALALGMRLVLAWFHARSDASPVCRDAPGASVRWLQRYRIAYAVHGLVWGAAGWLLQDAAGPGQFSLLTVALIAIAAGALNSTTFDVKAGMAFAVAAVSPFLALATFFGDPATHLRIVIMLAFMVVTLIGARRAELIFEEAERLRVAEAERAEEARRNAQAAEQARQELARRHYMLPLLMNTTRQGFWFLDNDGVTTDANPAMCELLGRPRDAVIGQSVFSFFSDEALAHMRRELAARKKGVVGNYEITLERPDGSQRHCVNNATPIRDASGQQIGSVGIWTDITARRADEVALRTYELVANSITDSVSAVGEDLRYRMVNDAWCRMTGRTREEAIGGTTSYVLSVISNEERRTALRECARQQQVRVVRDYLQFTDRPGFHAETTYYPYAGAIIGAGEDASVVVMVTRDVSAQENARLQLAESAEFLQRTLNATGDAIFASDAADPHQPLRFVNAQTLDLWGIPHDKMNTLTPADIMAYATPLFSDPVRETQHVADVIASNQRDESRVELRDGRVLWRRCIPARLGEKTLRVWSFRDITAESQAMETMRRSEASQRALLDAFPGFITRLDENMIYNYVNDRVAKRIGTTPERMIGKNFVDVVGPQTGAWLNGHVARLLKGEPVTYERHHDNGDGFGLFDQVTLALGVDAQTGGRLIYTFGIDITERKRVERRLSLASEQLQRRTEELQLTLDSIDQGIVSFDAAGVVGIHNPRALSLIDLPADLFEQIKTYDEIVRYQVQRGDLAPDASFVDVYGQHQYFKGGRSNSPDLYIRKNASGAVIEVRTRKLGNGGLVRTFADVTDYFEAQQALRESEAELRDLLGAFPGYIVATDENSHYTYVNERIASLMGQIPQSLIGRRVQEVVESERVKVIQNDIEAAKAGLPAVSISTYPANERHARIDLEVTHVAGRVKANGAQTVYVFGNDVTARLLAEEALVSARDAAETASRAKSEFLSRMSHELRTPMNAILGFGQLLELENQSDKDRMDWGHEVVKGGQHLLALINEVLDLARVESGRIEVKPESLKLKPLIDDCLMLVRPQAEARHIAISLQVDPPELRVHADRTRLKQILLNLLGNGVKYNAASGQLMIVCEVDPASTLADAVPAARISVTDTGAGLTPQQVARLFQPFERLDANLEQIEGTGIGLVLTKRLAELMDGRVGVQSLPGQGSTFWVTLPLTG